MRNLLYLVVLMAIAVLAGCSNSGTQASSRPTTPAPSKESPGTHAGAQSVTVELGEWFVRLNPSTVKAGEIHFTVKNVGKFTHAFAIQGLSVGRPMESIAAGKTVLLMLNLKADKYQIYCPIDNHRQRGMEATLQVQ